MNSINSSTNKANITINYIHEEKPVTQGAGTFGTNQTGANTQQQGEEGMKGSSKIWIWIILVVIILAIGGVIYFKRNLNGKVNISPLSRHFRVH